MTHVISWAAWYKRAYEIDFKMIARFDVLIESTAEIAFQESTPPSSFRAKTSPAQRVKSREPKDRDGIGYVVWCILGGPGADLDQAAICMRTKKSKISNIIHGYVNLSQEWLVKNNWREHFAAHYPQSWTNYQGLFELAVKQLIPCRGIVKKNHLSDETISLDWRCAAGEFVERVIRARGDAISDLLPVVSAPVLKKVPTWQRVMAGDPSLAASISKTAIREISNLYQLPFARPNTLYQEAQKLIEKLG